MTNELNNESTETTSPVSTTETSDVIDATTTHHKTHNNYSMWIGIGVTVVALIGGYILLFTDTDISKLNPFGRNTVALVNGEAIGQLEFQNSVKNVTDAYTQQGIDVSDPATIEVIESEAVKRLINTELLLQAANEAGYTADDTRVDEQLEVLKAEFGGEDALHTRLEELHLTEAMLRNDVREQIIVGDYLEKETAVGTITVSEEELATFYENLKGQYGEQLPPLEDIKSQMEADIRIQKQQAVLSEVLADLRAQADVEVRI